MKKRATLTYFRGEDYRLRRVIRYRSLFSNEYRIKVFPLMAQDIVDEVSQ